MNADQLRELADVIEPMGHAPRFSYVNVPAACAYLRACADALEKGPVAMGWRSATGEIADAISVEEANRNGEGAYTIPLYPVALPPALRLPEPMTDAEVFETMAWHEVDGYDIVRWVEAEMLRRVKEANNG